MATQEERLKVIATQLEASYQAMKRASSNIAGLLQQGKATCEEVKAYNLWAVAIYQTQRGMLATLRANGQPEVPELPPNPTMFALRGVPGEEAYRVNCGSSSALAGVDTFNGVMKRALKGPSANSTYLSTNEIEIVTQDPDLFNPKASPTLAELMQAQAGLGLAPVVWIAIAAISIGVSVALVALMKYLEVNEVQEANTKQTALQAEAFANYTAARLECFKQCTGSGKSTEECTSYCAKLVDKPNIKLPGMGDGKWGMLQWIGLTVVVGAGALVAYKVWERKREGRPVFELPSLSDALSGPPRKPKLVSVEWRDRHGRYRQGSFTQAELAELSEALRKQGITEITVDDREVALKGLALGVHSRRRGRRQAIIDVG